MRISIVNINTLKILQNITNNNRASYGITHCDGKLYYCHEQEGIRVSVKMKCLQTSRFLFHSYHNRLRLLSLTCETIYIRHRKYMKIDLYLLLEPRVDRFWSSSRTVEFLPARDNNKVFRIVLESTHYGPSFYDITSIDTNTIAVSTSKRISIVNIDTLKILQNITNNNRAGERKSEVSSNLQISFPFISQQVTVPVFDV
jgi:hypothetical protein